MALLRINKGDYNLVISDSGKKLRVKGKDQTYSQGTEFVNKPVDYEEVEEE